jgi:hypothetical protein
MRDAEETSEQWPGVAAAQKAAEWAAAEAESAAWETQAGRIRYAHDGEQSHDETFRGSGFPGTEFPGTEFPGAEFPGAESPSAGWPGAEFLGAGPFDARPFGGGRRSDLWVLVCGGVAAAAAFAAAFLASGGVASHPATPATMPAVVSQACPTTAQLRSSATDGPAVTMHG